jgi:hypothetical protein
MHRGQGAPMECIGPDVCHTRGDGYRGQCIAIIEGRVPDVCALASLGKGDRG